MCNIKTSLVRRRMRNLLKLKVYI